MSTSIGYKRTGQVCQLTPAEPWRRRLLHIERRRSDFIENIHDGSILDYYFNTTGEYIKLVYTTIIALWKAWKTRKQATGMIVHSDRGVQYAAHGYRDFLTRYCKAQQSMSRRGNCWDNAPVESFFATLKIEEFEEFVFRDLDHVRYQAARYIDHIYNQQRLHSTLGYVSPIQFEGAYFRQLRLTNSSV